MEASEVELGPVDIVVIGYPADAPLTGEAAPYLLDLVDRGIIRVLDVLFVMEGEDGTFSGFEATDIDSESLGDLHVFDGRVDAACSARTTSARRERSSPAPPRS